MTSGRRYIEAYNDPKVIEGQSTVTREIVEDAPDVDTIAIAVGGGGLVAGAALAAGGRRIVAVEPTGAAPCTTLWRQASRWTPKWTPSRRPRWVPRGRARSRWRSCRSTTCVRRWCRTTELLAARDRLWAEFRLAVEPAAAAGFAAFLRGDVPGELPCVILCGANSEWVPR